MQIEIEKKAWVHDREALLKKLKKEAQYIGRTFKKDLYFAPISPNRIKESKSKELKTKEPETFLHSPMVRLRYSNAGSIWVTSKKKSHNHRFFNHPGVEINEEIEFGISDSKSFEEFLRYLGLEKKIIKHKAVELFQYRGIQLELVDIETLGTFIEAEVLIGDSGLDDSDLEDHLENGLENGLENSRKNHFEQKSGQESGQESLEKESLEKEEKSSSRRKVESKEIELAIQKIESTFRDLNILKENIEEKKYIELLWEKHNSRDALYARK